VRGHSRARRLSCLCSPYCQEGFCFKIDNSLSNPIYAKHGLKGESIKYARVPVGLTSAILLVGSEQERRTWMAAIQEQINHATTVRNSGVNAPQSLNAARGAAESAQSATAATNAMSNASVEDMSDDDDDDVASVVGVGASSKQVDKLLGKYDDGQRQLFSGLAQQQVKIQKNILKAVAELDDKLQTLEKRTATIKIIAEKAAESGQLSIISVVIYVLVATVIAALVQRLFGGWLGTR